MTSTAFPSWIPGSHFGEAEMTRTASASSASLTLRSTLASRTSPSAQTLNCTMTRPSMPSALADSGYLMFWATHLANSLASPPLKVGLRSTWPKGTVSPAGGFWSVTAGAATGAALSEEMIRARAGLQTNIVAARMGRTAAYAKRTRAGVCFLCIMVILCFSLAWLKPLARENRCSPTAFLTNNN